MKQDIFWRNGAIYMLHLGGMNCVEIGKAFGLSPHTINRIVYRENAKEKAHSERVAA